MARDSETAEGTKLRSPEDAPTPRLRVMYSNARAIPKRVKTFESVDRKLTIAS